VAIVSDIASQQQRTERLSVPMIRYVRIAYVLACTTASIATTVNAQQVASQRVTGLVRDSTATTPVSGATIVLFDSLGRPVGRTISDALGRYQMSTTGDARRMRVVRLGFRPVEFALSATRAGSLDVALARVQTYLAAVHVTATASCPKRTDRGAALSLLEQVRAGLLTTVVSRSQNQARMRRLLFERQLDGEADRIRSQVVRFSLSLASPTPFGAGRSALEFVRRGFREDSAGSQTFFGPDAETLLDDNFTAGYCFQIAEPDRTRPNQIGLVFEPAAHRDGRVDITGALWVDTVARTLKDLEFRYVGIDAGVNALRPGGRLSFREMTNGVVVVDEWSLRLVTGREEMGGTTLGRGGETISRPKSRLSVQEIGGVLAKAEWPDGLVWRAPLGTLRLRAVTARGKPAVGTIVRLNGTEYQATADSSGSIAIEDLLPGPYSASIVDRGLAELGLPQARRLQFEAKADSTINAQVTVETAEEVVASRCARDAPIKGGAWIIGRVVDPDGRAAKDARWTIRDRYGSTQVEGGRVGTDGLFHWCQFPLQQFVEIDAWRDDLRGKVSRVLTAPLTVVRLEITAR
jgi:hypothetical protein